MTPEPRLASFDVDGWELRSAEVARNQHPDTFLLPPISERRQLERGKAAKLIFDIFFADEAEPFIQGERMWVIVARRIGNAYIGILDSPPASVEPGAMSYLQFGAEIPFLAEHVIDIADPPAEYVTWQLSQQPEYLWPPRYGDQG